MPCVVKPADALQVGGNEFSDSNVVSSACLRRSNLVDSQRHPTCCKVPSVRSFLFLRSRWTLTLVVLTRATLPTCMYFMCVCMHVCMYVRVYIPMYVSLPRFHVPVRSHIHFACIFTFRYALIRVFIFMFSISCVCMLFVLKLFLY